MKPMGILLLNSARRWIGEAAHTLALAQGLERRGHRVVVGVRRGYELEKRAEKTGMPILSLAMNSRFLPLSDLRDCQEIRRVVAERKIDLIHCNRGKDHWLAASANFMSRQHTPLVRGRHVVTPMRRHLFNRWLFRFATDGLLSVSEAARDSMGPLVSTKGLVDRVILSAVDSELFTPERRNEAVRRRLGADNDTILVGLVGRIQRVKGQRNFLAAAARVARDCPKARFLLAGRGNESQVADLLRYADGVGLDRDRVVMLGVVDDLPDIMAAFDIGVVASIGSEGSSRVSLEYMASGVAIVATRVGGIPDLVTDNAEGFLVEPGDIDAMAEKITTLAADPAKRKRLAAAGRQSSQERFHPDRWIDEAESLYSDVLAGGK